MSSRRANDSAAAACACGRLRRASRALTQLYDDAMAPAGLRVTQFALLRMLERGGPTGISELARRQLLDRTALSRTLDPLERQRLITIEAGRDARTRVVAITRAGHTALADAEPHWKLAQAQVTRRLGASKLGTLIGLLREVESLHPDALLPQR